MRSFWSDPYLWIHLAGLATLPIWLELCLLGLSVGDPVLPIWLELFLVGVVGIAPIVWMQWQRPFNIFSLLGVALKPQRLTEEQRKLLTLFTVQRNQFLAIAVALVLALALQKLYFIAPIAAPITPFAAVGRFGGLLIAAIAFLGANLFTQVPVAVLSVLFTSEATFAATLPFAVDQIPQRFTALGLPVDQILPPIVAEPPLQPASVPSSVLTRPASSTIAEEATRAPDESAVTAPLNSDELEDVWGGEAEEASLSGVEATADLPTTDEAAELPGEKPDLTIADVKTEEVKTEEDIALESDKPEAGQTSSAAESIAAVEEGWLDAAAIDDPASPEPPNSL
ncbi:MAG: low-complexity tail membrane protein [Leptolyngbyaceae cyanobacterium bins.302]|nr:low-complexity tail membrane protein [Leptolyngbyaceae cyanobacterium bins.302]